jgi:hypothetical protein
LFGCRHNMKNWKTAIQLLIAVILTAILVTGFWHWFNQDDIESLANKDEWGILQEIEYQNRGIPLKGIEFRNISDHSLVCLHATDSSRVWIMMDAPGSTRYKQMPGDKSFTITKQQLDDIIIRGKPSSTVERALASHLEPK